MISLPGIVVVVKYTSYMIHSKAHKDTPAAGAGASDASAAPPYYKSDLNIFTLAFSACCCTGFTVLSFANVK